MLRTLIISKNIKFVRNIVNENLCISIRGISTTKNTTYSILKNKDLDLIILDKNMLNNWIKSFCKIYKRKILEISMEEMNYNILQLKNKLDIIDSNQSAYKIKERITKELEYLNFNNKYEGTTYLKEVILEMYAEREKMIDNLEGSIYPVVAKRLKKAVKAIKTGIAYAINYMYYECELEKLKEYFHFYNDRKPSSKEVITTIISKIN